MKAMVTRLRTGRLGAIALAVALAAGLGAPSSHAQQPFAPTVIMISLDGTRPEDLSASELPALAGLIQRGASAEQMIPVFPTNTFPNHVSLVTGVEPARHGIVNNVFLDPAKGLFDYSNDPSWIQVEPLWSIAKRHGIESAAFHWIGSEGPWMDGRGPRYWHAFDSRTSEQTKVDQILAWLDIEDATSRPRLITSWFRGVDAVGHRFGPGSAEARAALQGQDRALARLVAELDRRHAFATTILLLVSDHGMLPVSRVVDLGAALRDGGIDGRVFGGGGIALVALAGEADGADAAARATAAAQALGLTAYRRDALPGGNSAANPRFGDLVVLAPAGTAISGRSGPPMRGSHGYLPAEPGMGALLIAVGGRIRPGARLGVVSTLDVAPTLLAWLGISPPEWMQGRPIAALLVEDGTLAPETVPLRADERGDR